MVSIDRQEESADSGMGGVYAEVVIVVQDRPLTGDSESDDPLLSTFPQYLDITLLQMDVRFF